MSTTTRVALAQLCATTDVAANLATSERLIFSAAEQGAEIVLLPEAFAFIGPDREKRQILEPLNGSAPSPILDRCQALAADTGCELIIGHHELPPAGMFGAGESEKSFNTCVHIGANGEIKAAYRKIHLFDIDLDDGTSLQESARTLPGSDVVITDTAFGILGLTICYDLRFPYLFQALVDRGAIAISVPSAFTATTGAAHWHALLRARAIETQCYVLAPAQYGEHNPKRKSYGHSIIIDPWGEVIAELPDGEGLVLGDIDPDRVHSVRRQLPSLEHRTELQE